MINWRVPKLKTERFALCGLLVFLLFFVSCASKPENVLALETPPLQEKIIIVEDSLSFAERALKEEVAAPFAERPSWVYYRYALEAMDNTEWLLARHYLNESLRLFIAEKHDTLYKNVSPAEDSLYRLEMPFRIVNALDEVFPNVADMGEIAENFGEQSFSIEGVDELDEKTADSASLVVIENFLDTLDVKQFSLPIEFNERVMQEIFYMTNGARKFTAGSLNRKTAYDEMIYAKLDSMDMPRDLIYLALVESGFKVKAYSRAKASGMWQFIPETGKRYGLEVDYWVDMRRNPELATNAALKYLKRLYDEFNDWLLAMAAYNCGEGRVRRLVKEMKADTLRDSTQAVSYWELSLPKETMRYVPRILAAMVIGHYPSEYQMEIQKETVAEFDTVTVFDSFPLEEVAKILNVKEDTIRALNMELIKWCTPPNKESYLLRVPLGMRSQFVDNYDKMEKNNFSSWHHHKVKKGESLGIIARQYGISIAELKQANDMKNDRIRAGKSLLIPIKVTPKKSKNTSAKKPVKVKTYIVKLGDNIPAIARLFGLSAENLREWNKLDETSLVKEGDTLFVSKPELKPSEETTPLAPILSKGSYYTVQAGDTYADIAKKADIPLLVLLEANNGFYKRLNSGDSIFIPEFTKPKKEPPKKATKKEVKKSTSKEAPTSIYTVQSGDNLYAISKKFSTTVEAIQSLNNMGSSTSIYVGQKLKIAGTPTEKKPAKTTTANEIIHEVKKGEGLWDIARQYKVTIEDIVKWNNLKDTKIKIGDKLFIKR